MSMDYTSFAPGPSSKPNVPQKIEPQKPKHHLSGFWALVINIVLLGLVVVGGFWWWQQMQIANDGQDLPVFTPRMEQVIYQNNQYGFSITLPASWKGYTVKTSQWQGQNLTTNKIDQQGVLLTLRSPQWTQDNQTEDMPIMIFTPAQWDLVSQEKLAVGAAPIPPSMLGENSQYVLALPARYNYDYKPGWEEVDQAVHTLKAFEPGSTAASPTPSSSITGIHCGGNIKNAPTCPSGYTCQLYISEPDAGGVCVKN